MLVLHAIEVCCRCMLMKMDEEERNFRRKIKVIRS